MKVVCVVAHPDDEVLGVGGTLARHVMEGDDVHVVIVCGNTFRGNVPWREQAEASLNALGVTKYTLLGWQDQRLDEMSFNGMITRIAGLVGDSQDVWYTHWYKDLNRDHRIVNEIVQVIARSKYGKRFEVREFPTPSSSDYNREPFVPDTWIEITKTLEKKNRALEAYKNDLQDLALSRNVRGMNTHAIVYGSEVGLQAAEIFATARRVI